MTPHRTQKIGFAATVWLVLSAVIPAPVLADPSFDCGRATTPEEHAICADPILARVDTLVAQAYLAFEPSFQNKRSIGRALLNDRNACGANKACILAAQYQSLENYGAGMKWIENALVAALSAQAYEMDVQNTPFSRATPQHPGECVRTRVASFTTRWGDPVSYDNADAGTVVGYENGVSVVSYDRPWSVANVEVGQPVVQCLMSIPYDCPQGDTRGRFYYTSNLITNSDWIMPDAQHMCGGA